MFHYPIKRKSSVWEWWRQPKGFAVLFLGIALTTIPCTLAFAQEKSIDSPSPAMQEKVSFSPQHRIGWGISSSEGAVTYSNDSGEILISMLYARRITPITELELALHYTGIQRYFKGLNGLVPLTSSARGISIAWHADITFMMQPFTGFFQPLRLGLGPSLLLGSGISTGNSLVISDTATPPTNIPLQTNYRSIASLAMNAKAEWLFLQRPTFDIGGRVQLHLFTSAFSGGSQIPAAGGLGSAGVFAYVRF